jgi:hypothetical protein
VETGRRSLHRRGQVELTLGNGDVVTVDIDPTTLAARSGKIDRCTDADYPTWSD